MFRTIATAWIAVMGLSLAWNWHQTEESAVMFATAEARASYEKDLVYRRWAAIQGGVYVPPSQTTPANPYLAHLPDRDITTVDGKQLTLVNPAYMTRQVYMLAKEQYGVQGKITSLKPLNPANVADSWETAALNAFAAGSREVVARETMNGETHLRLIRPLITEKPCLKCHASQGYREGDIRGGISVSIPFSPYAVAAERQQRQLLFAHLLICALGLLGLGKGNSLLRASESQVLKSDERYKNVLHAAMDGFLLVDLQGHLLETNQTYSRMSGYSVEELLTMSIADLDVVEGAGDIASRIQSILTLGKSRFESKHRRKDGSVMDVEISAQYRPSEGDRLIVFLHDITERKQAEEEHRKLTLQLYQAQKMEAIGTLAGGIAHDFNNILGAILGYAELVRDDCPAGSNAAHDVDQVLKAGTRAKELVKQILAFSRQSEGERIPLQPAAIIVEAVKMLRATLPTTISIEQDIDPAAGVILANPTQIHQILMNLGTNSCHAMEAQGGVLSISLQKMKVSESDFPSQKHLKPGTFVRLSVKDTGVGILPEVKDKIFDPYFTTKATGKGTGMGLAMVHGIVESYGGAVICESTPGEGTVFHIILPTIDSGTLLGNTAIEPVPTGNEHILLIDDEEMLVEMGKAMLTRMGYRVTTRTNGFEALATFRNEPDAFDLVISDQTMPGMTGSELARRMMAIRPDLPIILCTGYSSTVSEEEAKMLGIKGFAFKPLTKKEVGILVRKILDGN